MDSGEGRMQLFICCQTRGDTDGLGLGEQRKKRRTVRSLPGFALCHPCLSRRCLLEFGDDTRQQVRGVRLGGTCRGCPKEVWAGKERGYSWCSVAALGTKFSNYIWGTEEREREKEKVCPKKNFNIRRNIHLNFIDMNVFEMWNKNFQSPLESIKMKKKLLYFFLSWNHLGTHFERNLGYSLLTVLSLQSSFL